VSTREQVEGGVSLDAQRAKLEAYAVAMELDLVAIEVDAGVSAKSLQRPGLQAALARLEAGEAGALLVVKLDRLTRSVGDLGWLVEAERFGGRWALLSVADSIDTRSAGGRLVLNVLASVAQWERESTAERTREALAHIRREGTRLGGEALGWKRTDERDEPGRCKVVRVQAEAETARRIVELRQQGQTLQAIADALTAEGRPTKRGGQWRPCTVARVLRRAQRAA